jgi:uncharacterized sulfatase
VAPGTTGAGQTCQRLVELLDVYPTLVELCALPQVKELEGSSLRALLQDPQAAWTEAAHTQVLRGELVGRSVRTPRWRYTEWDEGRAGAQLYDHDADPREYRNLADDPQYASVRATLRRLLQPKGDVRKRAAAAPKPPVTTGS